MSTFASNRCCPGKGWRAGSSPVVLLATKGMGSGIATKCQSISFKTELTPGSPLKEENKTK